MRAGECQAAGHSPAAGMPFRASPRSPCLQCRRARKSSPSYKLPPGRGHVRLGAINALMAKTDDAASRRDVGKRRRRGEGGGERVPRWGTRVRKGACTIATNQGRSRGGRRASLDCGKPLSDDVRSAPRQDTEIACNRCNGARLLPLRRRFAGVSESAANRVVAGRQAMPRKGTRDARCARTAPCCAARSGARFARERRAAACAATIAAATGRPRGASLAAPPSRPPRLPCITSCEPRRRARQSAGHPRRAEGC